MSQERENPAAVQEEQSAEELREILQVRKSEAKRS